MKVPTIHNEAKFGDIAKTVIMPGDPLRSKYIAEKYLTDVICYNDVRNMYGYTGKYKGVRISIQGSGMGVPSMGIYSKELFEGYGVDNIIRVGSAGALALDIKLRDIIVAETVYTDSNYIKTVTGNCELIPVANIELLNKLKDISKEINIKIKIGKVYTSDICYDNDNKLLELSKMDVLAVEMETLALYTNAKLANKKAITILTISDKPLEGTSLESEEREKGFEEMMKLSLELALKCEKES